MVTYGYFPARYRATGKDARTRFVFRWDFRDGRVSRFESMLDTATVVAALRP